MLWGYGPAVDVLEEISDVKSVMSKNEINILIIGASDARHILQTISRYYKRPRKKINFYVADVMLEMVARQILLLLIALEPPDELGLFDKTRLWMEVYGNILVRPNTNKYIVKKSYQLVNMITSEVYLNSRLPLVSVSMMKYKERDNLETIFQFWAKNRFENVLKLWDGRIRQSLGTRYDSKEGVFDWDYYMRLKEIPEGERINPREYKHWRGTGVAFTWLECEETEPNPTMASGIVKLGSRLLNHGYLGDIVSPPYLAFGTDSEDKNLLEVRNNVMTHRSTDIVEANLRRMFHEIATQTPYEPQAAPDPHLGAVITELPEVLEVPECEEKVVDIQEDCRRKEDYSAISVPDTKVHFLSTNALLELPRRPRFRNFFDVVMVSQNLTQRLSDDVMSMVRPGGVLLAETRKFITGTSKKEKEDFAEHLVQLGKDRSCRPLRPVDGVNDYLAKFLVERKD
ncbi:dynein axonemal assembly factor 3 [Macrosteles quadrilineatus]|uniref:dynein axonemal assembly factor 3 n=1 Tax=Macrosteles quadrilineatus TaxID=74068 RepID=UPI0023E24A61|nr:dynein axonemal assembly factor 3 [Macrosteles quadrilineatus]